MNNKIYITGLHLMHGGVEMVITLLANALDARGFDVEILCSYNLGEPVYRLSENVKVTYLTEVHPNRDEFKAAIRSKKPFKILKEAIYAIKVLRLKKLTFIKKFKEINSGTVISTRNEHTVLLSKYGRQGVKKISHLHHDHLFDKNLLRDFKKRYDNIDYMLLLTDRLTEEVKEVMKNNRHTRVLTMPNFIETAEFCRENQKHHQAVAVGRLHSVKGFDRLIELWKNIQFSELITLKIIGDGEERARLEALIKQYGLEEKVILTGALPHGEVLRQMSNSMFYAMTSHSEGFGLVIVEAMQMGLPVIAYDVRVGPEAIIEDGINGFLIPNGDARAFAEKVRLLAQNEELLREMSENAIKRSKDFSEENIIGRWIELIK